MHILVGPVYRLIILQNCFQDPFSNLLEIMSITIFSKGHNLFYNCHVNNIEW